MISVVVHTITWSWSSACQYNWAWTRMTISTFMSIIPSILHCTRYTVFCNWALEAVHRSLFRCKTTLERVHCRVHWPGFPDTWAVTWNMNSEFDARLGGCLQSNNFKTNYHEQWPIVRSGPPFSFQVRSHSALTPGIAGTCKSSIRIHSEVTHVAACPDASIHG
jgi:hypothetical protein